MLMTLAPTFDLAIDVPSTQVTDEKKTSVQVAVEFVNATTVAFSYTTLGHNNPNAYKNQVSLWQSNTAQIPFGSPEQSSAVILGTHKNGDQTMVGQQITNLSYVLGYAVGPDTTCNPDSQYFNTVASAFIPAERQKSRSTDAKTCNIQTNYVGRNTVAFDYAFLAGFVPNSAKAWVGLWKGKPNTYDTAPTWHAALETDQSSSSWAFNGVTILPKRKYTLGLFSTGFSEDSSDLDLKRLAAKSVFSTGDGQD